MPRRTERLCERGVRLNPSVVTNASNLTVRRNPLSRGRSMIGPTWNATAGGMLRARADSLRGRPRERP
jgi:hypothetical protein